MLLREYLLTNDLWAAIGGELPTLGFISEMTPEKLDAQLDYKYGDRTMLSSRPVNSLASIIALEFGDKWARLEAVKIANIDFLVKEKKTLIDRTTNVETKGNTREDVNKVSGFNSDILITNDGSNSTGSEDLDGEKNREASTEVRSTQDVYKNLSILEKNDIIQTVTKDVADFVTLSIYQ